MNSPNSSDFLKQPSQTAEPNSTPSTDELTDEQLDAVAGGWWNYELTNRRWSGSSDLTNTNNSLNFYFWK